MQHQLTTTDYVDDERNLTAPLIPDVLELNYDFIDAVDDHNWHFNVADEERAAQVRANRERNIAYAKTKFRLDSLPAATNFFNLWVSGQQLLTADGERIDRPLSTLRAEGLLDSALDDLDELTQYDQIAADIKPKTKVKSLLAVQINATTFETFEGHIQRRKDGSSYKRATITHDNWIGDGFQRDNGELIIVAVTIPSPHGDIAVVVEAEKRHLNIRNAQDRNIWKHCKGTQTMRPGNAWVYEPVRQIDLGIARALDPWEAETVAQRWHSEQIQQQDADGFRIQSATSYTADRPKTAMKGRAMSPVEARRFVEHLSEGGRAAIAAALR